MSKSKKRPARAKRLRLAVIVRKRLLDPATFWSLLARAVR
jgi:hypothetical protein